MNVQSTDHGGSRNFSNQKVLAFRICADLYAARGSSKVTSSGSANGASDGTSNGTSGSSSSSTSTAASMSGTATSRSDYSFPTPVSHGYPDLDILAIGSDKHVYHKYRDPSSLDDFGPSTLTREDLGDTNSTEFTTLAALWRSAADLDLFLVGGDKKMYHKYFSGSSWGPSAGFEPRDGISTTAPTAVAWDADTLDIFTLGEGSALYRQMWSRSDGWVDWNGLGGNWANYAPTVVSWAQGQLDVFVVSSVDHTLHHGFVTTNRTWQAPDGDPFDNLGGYLTGRPVAV